MAKPIGILTGGGDAPGISAAIRGVGERKPIPPEHLLVESAVLVGTCSGDRS